MSYVTKSDIRVKSYDHSNFSRASVVQFRASCYIMSPNRTSVWKVITIQICRELSLFNFERLDILCSRIGHPCEKLWPFEFLENFRCSISSVSIYYSPNRTSMWKLMTIRISRELPLLNFERLDELCLRIEHSCEKLWPFKFVKSFRCSISRVSIYYVPESNIRVKSYDHTPFSRASVVQFRASRYIMSPNRTSVWKVMTIRIPRELPLFNFERLDILFPESNIYVKTYDHSNFSRASFVKFWASRWVMSPNRTFVWKVTTIRISRELPLFNFERLDELCPRIGHAGEK